MLIMRWKDLRMRRSFFYNLFRERYIFTLCGNEPRICFFFRITRREAKGVKMLCIIVRRLIRKVNIKDHIVQGHFVIYNIFFESCLFSLCRVFGNLITFGKTIKVTSNPYSQVPILLLCVATMNRARIRSSIRASKSNLGLFKMVSRFGEVNTQRLFP